MNDNEYKGYRIVPTESFTFHRIINVGSGKASNQLSGAYTDKVSAMKAIDQLQSDNDAKEASKRPGPPKSKPFKKETKEA